LFLKKGNYMAIKKKQASKPARPKGGKATKPVKKAAAKKPVAKKPMKSNMTKPSPKKAAKPVVAKKPVPKAVVKPVAKPAPPVAPKAVAKPEVPAPKPLKPGVVDPKSLVSIKVKVKPVIKKEPPKHSKIVIPKTTTKSSVKYEPEFTKSVLDVAATTYQSEGPTMRYSDSDLTEFREIIQKKLDAAKKELAYLQGLITRKEEGGDMDEGRYMTMEDGSVSMEREQLSQMASRQITFIDHLEKAMMRIENKTYGICRVTGKLIDKARLRAVPHATLSIEAKQMMNK
jgi:RNA polymerase-binding transcription factor DksA